jgi:hypothetical protein
MSRLSLSALGATFCLLTNPSHAHDAHAPDAHAPIGVMGDHSHGEGEFMVSYRYMSMGMKGNRDGTSSLSPAQVRARGFNMVPLNMTMEMHMLGAMYGYSDNLTLTTMLPYIRKEMDVLSMGGQVFHTETEGIGDAKIGGIYVLGHQHDSQNASRQQWHLNVNLSLPTGAIDERGPTPMSANAKRPYPMHLGTGTFDPSFGLTYNRHYADWSWGAQGMVTFRLGENDENYRFGHQYEAAAWSQYRFNDAFSFGARVTGQLVQDIEGRDPDLMPTMIPTADPNLFGARRILGNLSLNYIVPEGQLRGQRFAVEAGIPLYEDLDGPQMSQSYSFTAGWQYAF